MQKLTLSLALSATVALAVAACDKKPTPSPAPAASAAKPAAAPKGPDVPTGGSLDVEVDDEYTTLKVGPAYAVPTAKEGGNVYSFYAYNAGAPETSCDKKINGDTPIGGDNWAVVLDMSSGAAPFRAGDKDKQYDDVTTNVYFVAKSGPWKGKARGINPFSEEGEKKLTLVSADDKTITVKVDVSNKNGHVKGEFKAQLCPPAK